MIKNIVIKDQSYEVHIKQNKRAKHLQLKVYKTGEVKVTVPAGLSLKAGERFLNQKRDWLEKKISKLAFNMNKFRYLGCELKVSINTYKEDITFFLHDEKTLLLKESDNCSVNELFEVWLFERASEYIPKRVNELAVMHGFKYNKVRVKKLTSRWGSCSSKKNLSFNYKLISYSRKVIDYVIVHELCHLKEMNHSKKFWQLVESILPDYKDSKKTLLIN